MAKVSQNRETKRDDYYTSLEQWKLENFPNVIEKRQRKELEKDPEALGTAIANKIFHKIGVELAKNP